MRTKTYVTPKVDVVLIHTATLLQDVSVINPGKPNEPAGTRPFEIGDGLDELPEFNSWNLL